MKMVVYIPSVINCRKKTQNKTHKYFPLLEDCSSVNFLPPTDHPSGPQDVPEYILFVVNNANICFSPRQGPSSERRRKSRSEHLHQQQLRRSWSWHQDRSGEIFLTVSILPCLGACLLVWKFTVQCYFRQFSVLSNKLRLSKKHENCC